LIDWIECYVDVTEVKCETACVSFLLHSTSELIVHGCLQSAIIHLSTLYDKYHHLIHSLTR